MESGLTDFVDGNPEEARSYVQYSGNLGDEICRRTAAGETLTDICASEGMPTPKTVRNWARDLPAFDQRFRKARLAGARPVSGKSPGYTPEIADAIVVRVAEGERIDDILRDPDMPCRATLYTWMARHSEFAQALALAREAEVDRLADESWIIARSARPETARLAAVQLAHLRWLARVRAPRVYHQRPVEPPPSARPDDVVRTGIELHQIEFNPETGLLREVTYFSGDQPGDVQMEEAGPWFRPQHPIVDYSPPTYPPGIRTVVDGTADADSPLAPASQTSGPPQSDDERWV